MIFQKSALFVLALLFATIATCEGGGGLAAATEPSQQRRRRFKASKKGGQETTNPEGSSSQETTNPNGCTSFYIGRGTGCDWMCQHCATILGTDKYYFTDPVCTYESGGCVGNPIANAQYTCCAL